jgi:hypothetical protein
MLLLELFLSSDMLLDPLPLNFYGDQRELVAAVKAFAGSQSLIIIIKNINKAKGFVYLLYNYSNSQLNSQSYLLNNKS